MADLIDRDSIEKKKVVASVTAMDIESGQELGSGIHSGHELQGLYHIGGAEQGKTGVYVLAVDALEASLGRIPLGVYLGGDYGLVDGIMLFLDEDGVIPGLLL